MTREELIEVMARRMVEAECGPTSVYGYATAALTAIEAAGARLVPVEPSRHMLLAAHMVESDDIELTEDEHRAMYAAFVAASPYAPPGG